MSLTCVNEGTQVKNPGRAPSPGPGAPASRAPSCALRVAHQLGSRSVLVGAAARAALRPPRAAEPYTDRVFERLPPVPDHARLEEEILAFWEERGIFAKLRERTAGGPRFSFFDGPVTANKTLGVHTAWGRTLKDVFQRYKALRGFDQRYQNGFDCQGLWIEVGVERELGLNSKREIEEYGLAEFARRCREKVAWSAGELTRGSIRLGQWMDWGNDYFTFSDTNIEYIWRFLRHMHDHGWLYRGHRSTEWCPRCGTSISQHELIGHYFDKTDPSLFVRFPLLDRAGESLAVWTTTPWTLPANVAAAVNPDAEYGRRRERRVGSRRTGSRRRVHGARPGLGSRRPRLRRPVRQPPGGPRGRAPRHPVGGGLARGGHGDRPHRARVRQPRTSSSPVSTTSRC